MADSVPGNYNVGPPGKDPLKRAPSRKAYFFLDGVLHKSIRQERARDVLTALHCESEKIVKFHLSDAKRRMKPAYDTVEVGEFLNRNRYTVLRYVGQGRINEPVRLKMSGVNAFGHPFTRLKWSEDDILALHEWLLMSGGGRPRNDGILYEGARLPSRRELIARMKQQPMFYMKTAEGEMIPVWSAYNEV